MRLTIAGAIILIVPASLTRESEAQGFPPRPVPAATTAAGDAGTHSYAVDAVFLNPARAAEASGFAATYAAHEQTGLRGYSLSAGFVAGLPAVLSAWKYEAGDLFDQEILDADPTLALFSVHTTGMDLATAAVVGPVVVGIGTSVEFHHVLTTNTERFAMRLGALWDTPAVMAGFSWRAVPDGSLISGFDAGTGRWTAVVRPMRGAMLLEIGAEAAWTPASDRFGFTTSVVAGPLPLRVIAGWRWSEMEAAAGIVLTMNPMSLTVARELGGGESLGGLTALTFALSW